MQKQSSTLDNRTDWVVTLPAHVSWETYTRELDAVSDWTSVLNFRVPFTPSAKKGDRCYVLYRGQVRGWMAVTGVLKTSQGFTCETTGAFWKPGNYIQRAGPWHAISDGPRARGFQGIRRISKIQHAEQKSSKLETVNCKSCGEKIVPRKDWCKWCPRCGRSL